MPAASDLRFAFNRGEVGKSSLARVDRDGLRLAAETCLNWMPTPQGPMLLRPGTQYLDRTKSDGQGKMVRFVFSRTDTAMIILTANVMRVMVDDEYVTRPSITTTVLKNGNFSSTAGWNTASDTTSGATATISGGTLTLTATARGSKARAFQTVAYPADHANRNVQHALRVVVTRGPVLFKVGTTKGSDDLVKRTSLGTGTHSLAFTPTTGFTVEFENTDRAARIIDSCTLESSGTLELPTDWGTSDFDSLQYVQSGDVVFFAWNGRQKKVERRRNNSWSVVGYEAALGPLRDQKPREKDISLRSTVYEGNGRLIADDSLFTSDYLGTIFRCFPTGQERQTQIAADDTWTDPIRISGVDQERKFNIVISGSTTTTDPLGNPVETQTWAGTLQIQFSLDGPDIGFKDVAEGFVSGSRPTFTANGTYDIYDRSRYNNSVVWYRVGFKKGGYQSGLVTISFSGNSSTGGGDAKGTSTTLGGSAAYAKILSIVSPTIAEIEVVKPFGSLNETKDWKIGEWNEDDGFPTAVTLFDGRLWWGGKDRLWGSVSDDYENFDHDFEGEAGPISRSLGTGPVDSIAWLLPLARLMAGRGAAVSSVRSSNFDEPLTPTNFTIRDASTRGAAPVMPVQVDSRGVYIHANNRQLFELAYRVETQDYTASDLTAFNQDIGLPGFARIAVARSPDTRVFVVRDDGQMAVVLREQDGDTQLASWWRITTGTSDTFEDVAVLPGDYEDKVYVIVLRGTQRCIEVFARRDECIGEPLTKCLDSHVVYSGSPTRTITGLSHLNGKTVRVWGATTSTAATGEDLGQYVVSGGSIGLLPRNVRVAVVGLPYTATFLSAKLAYGAGLSIGAMKHIDNISFVLFDTHAQGLRYGQDLNRLNPMPLMEDGEVVEDGYIWSHYDKQPTSLPGRWDIDSRLALRAQSPRPVTVGAVLITVDTSGRNN